MAHITLQDNTRKARQWIPFAEIKLRQLKAISHGIINQVYVPVNCVKVHVMSVNGIDRIRISACGSGEKCGNSFEDFDNPSDFTDFQLWFIAHARLDNGDKAVAFPTDNRRITGYYEFDDTNLSKKLNRVEVFLAREFSAAGEINATLYTYQSSDKSGNNEFISVRYPMDFPSNIHTLSIDTEGFKNAFGVFTFPMNQGFGELVTVVIDGEVRPYIFDGLNSEVTGTLVLPKATGEEMIFTISMPTRNFFFSPAFHNRYGITFTKYKCLAKTVKTITVPSPNPEPPELS